MNGSIEAFGLSVARVNTSFGSAPPGPVQIEHGVTAEHEIDRPSQLNGDDSVGLEKTIITTLTTACGRPLTRLLG